MSFPPKKSEPASSRNRNGSTERKPESPVSEDGKASAILAIEYSGHSLRVINAGRRVRRDPRSQLSWYVGECECGSSSPLEPSNGHAKAWHYRHLQSILEGENLA